MDLSLKALLPECFDTSAYDSIERLTSHVCRHSWPYMMLSFSFEKYKKENVSQSDLKQSVNNALLKAQDDLKALGGWSPTSTMPIYYGKRFIVERANFMNLARIIDSNVKLWAVV